MASFVKTDKQMPPTAGSSAYATVEEPLRIPKTPLESRQGYHPKSVGRAPPTSIQIALSSHVTRMHRKSNFDGADPQQGSYPGKGGYSTRATYVNVSTMITLEREIVSCFS